MAILLSSKQLVGDVIHKVWSNEEIFLFHLDEAILDLPLEELVLLGRKLLLGRLHLFGALFRVTCSRLHPELLQIKTMFTKFLNIVYHVRRREHLKDLDQVVICELELLHAISLEVLLCSG